jgi:hypothetical protein
VGKARRDVAERDIPAARGPVERAHLGHPAVSAAQAHHGGRMAASGLEGTAKGHPHGLVHRSRGAGVDQDAVASSGQLETPLASRGMRPQAGLQRSPHRLEMGPHRDQHLEPLGGQSHGPIGIGPVAQQGPGRQH